MRIAVFIVHKDKKGVYHAKANGLPISLTANTLDEILSSAREATVRHFWSHRDGDRCMISIVYNEEVT